MSTPWPSPALQGWDVSRNRGASFAFLIMAMIASKTLAATTRPTTLESRVAIARSLWDAELAKTQGKPQTKNQYPTEPAVPFLSAYDFTHEKKFADQAVIQLDYAHSREKNALLITFEGICHRDYQARQIYNFYLAYRILKDPKYLAWADACASAMVKTIPRQPHTFAGETHTLFAATFIKPDGKPDDPLAFTIDVNQNAEVGFAFSQLYHDPKSAFYQKRIAREIAYEETLASMSLQDMKTGAIPLREGLMDQYDTAYGGYATFSWTGTQLLWHEPKFDPHLRAAAKWLAPLSDVTRDTRRWYPKRIDGGPMSLWEIWFRVPALWYSDIDARKLLNGVFERMGHPDGYKDEAGLAPSWWAYYDTWGIPREYYLTGDPSAGRNGNSK